MTRSEPLSMRPIRGVAVDQGSGLARMLRQARGAKAGKGDLLLFKRLVAEQLSPEASTLLVDANYGRELLPSIAPGCESMLAYEADVYRIADEDRMTVLPEDLRIADYPGLGVRVLKFFLLPPTTRPRSMRRNSNGCAGSARNVANTASPSCSSRSSMTAPCPTRTARNSPG